MEEGGCGGRGFSRVMGRHGRWSNGGGVGKGQVVSANAGNLKSGSASVDVTPDRGLVSFYIMSRHHLHLKFLDIV